MVFIGGFVFPHGGATLDPNIQIYSKSTTPAFKPTTKAESLKLNLAMKLAAAALISLQPTILILSTPHGFILENNYVFLRNSAASGVQHIKTENGTSQFSVNVRLAGLEAVQMSRALKNEGSPTESMAFGIGQSVMPLLWAEVIPLSFIQDAATAANFTMPKVIYVGQRIRKEVETYKKHVKELLHLGRRTANYIRDNLEHERVAMLISCDLSHYHSNDTSSPYQYQYSQLATVFDNYCVEWAKSDFRKAHISAGSKALLEDAAKIEDEIGACGFTGLVYLHGALTGTDLPAHFFGYSVPSYFGMIVAGWY